MNFLLYFGDDLVAKIRPRGDSWFLLLIGDEAPFNESQVKSFFGACDFLSKEKAAISCNVDGFLVAKEK